MKNFLAVVLISFFSLQLNEGKAAKTVQVVQINTAYGGIYIWLYKDTPIHRKNFLDLAMTGFYDSLFFHRVIETFMVQGGDPYTKNPAKKDSIGNGGPGYTLEAELKTTHFHKRGALAAARMGDNVNPQRRSSGSQFYIVQGKKFSDAELLKAEKRVQAGLKDTSFHFTPEQKAVYKEVGGAPHLDRQYTVFGEVIKGMDVVDKIAAAEKVPVDRPKTPIYMDINILLLTKKQFVANFGMAVPES